MSRLITCRPFLQRNCIHNPKSMFSIDPVVPGYLDASWSHGDTWGQTATGGHYHLGLAFLALSTN